MNRDFSRKKGFMLLLVTIYAVTIPLITVITYVILRENAVRNALVAGRLYLASVASIKHYVSDELRPLFYRELPGRFLLQGMSRSYIASRMALRVQKDLPNYEYKNASTNPMNPLNAADTFEEGVIAKIAGSSGTREWNGFRNRGGVEFYSIAVTGDPFTEDCLKCHGNPSDAPSELLERYGTKSGFHVKAGEINDAAFIYIPMGVPLASARKITLLFVAMYAIFGTVILTIVSRRFSALYNKIDEDKGRIEDINLELMNLNHDMEGIITERTMNLIALSVADRVRNPATTIAATFNRILKKEVLSDPLRERLTDMLVEAQKLDAIVKDYEAVLRNKQTMFRMEDLNEIASSVLPLVETERKTRNVSLFLNLSLEPRKCMASRQLLRVAVLHLLKNAIESVESVSGGGRVSIETAGDGDHVSLTVTDNGVGIPQEEVGKIFSLFVSSKSHRLGMGLPLVKQIVDEHKGSVEVRSRPGEETTFTLTFPSRWSEQELSR